MRSFERLCAYIAEKIRYTAAPVAELLAGAAGESEFEAIRPFLSRFTMQENWRTCFEDSVRSQLSGQGLDAEDLSLIRGWGEGLGFTDVAGQVAHCRQFEERLGQQAAGARQQALSKGKLYTSLGVASGLVVTLLWL